MKHNPWKNFLNNSNTANPVYKTMGEKNLSETIQAIKMLLRCNEIDPDTRKQAEKRLVVFETELANLPPKKRKPRSNKAANPPRGVNRAAHC